MANDQSDPEVLSEVRTRRLVLMGQDGKEQAILGVNQDVVELRLGGRETAMPCAVVLFAGEQEPGSYSAGLELWANGNSIAGCNVTVAGSQVRAEWFGSEGSDI